MMNIKKKIMVIFATGIMAFSASPFVLAATPAPANNTQQAEQVDTTQQDTANQNNRIRQIPMQRHRIKIHRHKFRQPEMYRLKRTLQHKFQIRNTCQRDGLYFGLYSLL